MDELTPLPADDPDAILARRIGEGEAPSEEDVFERVLAAYRRHANTVVPPTGFSDRLWGRLSSIDRPERTALRLVSGWSRWAVAAAAVCLIAYASWRVFDREPTLVSATAAAVTTVSLDDGSLVTLRPHSELFKTASDVYLLSGEALFEVVPDPSRVFRVRTDLGEVSVLGTRFDLSTWGGETTVYLDHGRVAFRHLATGAADTLAPGEELLASASALTVSADSRSADVALDWTRGMLVFGQRPLGRIVAELEQHFAITVLIPDSLKMETLSGQILLAAADQSLRDLGTALGARFEQSEPNVFRLVPN